MKQVLFSIGLLLALIGCARPDDIDSPIDAGRVKFLMDGKWMLTGQMVYLGGDMSKNVDAFPTIEECVRDNYYIFTSNSHAQMWQGFQKCKPSDGDQADCYYNLSNNENEIYMDRVEVRMPALPDTTIVVMHGQMEYPAYNTFYVKSWVGKDFVIRTYTRYPIED